MAHILGNLLAKQLYKLGYLIGRHPSYFVIIPLFVCLLCATGLQNMKYEKNVDRLYLPSESRFLEAKNSLNELYPMNYSTIFSRERLIDKSRFGSVIVIAKDNLTLFREQIFWEIVLLDRIIRNLTIEFDDFQLTYEDICAKLNEQCWNSNTILDLAYQIKEIESNSTQIRYPVWFNKDSNITYYFYNQIGGLILAQDSVVLGVRAIQLNYYLDLTIKYGNELAILFEEKFVDVLKSLKDQFEYLDLAPYASFSTARELDSNLQQFTDRFNITFALMLLFGLVSSLMLDCVQSKPYIGLLQALVPLLGLLGGFGLCSYIGIEMTTINWIILYIVIGNSMQDAFLMLAVWRRTSIHLAVRERLAETYSEAMSSITINNFVNCSFYIASYFITSFKVIQIFCLYITVSLVIIYILQLTVFGGLLAIFGHIEGKNLHSLICVPVISRSGSADQKWIFRAFCSGGINAKDSDNELDNRVHYLMQFFRDGFAKLINNTFLKALILFAFVGHLAIGTYNISQLNEGLDRLNLFNERSYAREYIDYDQNYFLDNKYAIQVIINETLDYSNSLTQFRVEKLISKVESTDYMDRQTQCWLRSYMRFVQLIRQQRIRPVQFAKYNLTQKADFYEMLKNVFLPMPSNFIYRSDIVFNENLTDIISSRCIVFSGHLVNSSDEKEMLNRLYNIADSSKLNITFYNQHFGLFEQYSQVRTLTINFLILLVVVLVINCILFMPTFSNLFWLVLITISIELGSIGYLANWNVNLDFITILIVMMNIVFSTNCIIHVSCAYFESKNYNSQKRIRSTLFTVGYPLSQSYLLKLVTIASITLSSFSFSSIDYIYSTFAKFTLILIVLCAYHELLLLPVLLTLCKQSIHPNNKHLHDLSDLDDQESEDDFSRKARKSYYKYNARQRIHDPPFYYTEKWFVDSKLYHSDFPSTGISHLSINSRSGNRNVAIPRLIMNQPKSNHVNFPLSTGNRLSTAKAVSEDAKNQQVNSAITIWDKDEDIRNNVISKFNEHWKQLNSKEISRQPDHLCQSNAKDVLKSQTGLQVRSTESSDLGLGTSSEENSEGSWKLKKGTLPELAENLRVKSRKTNRTGAYFNFGRKTQQFTHFRPLPPIPQSDSANTKSSTFYQSNKDKGTAKNSEANRLKPVMCGVPGSSSFLVTQNKIKKNNSNQDWLN